jgi:hypothetical protein
VPPVLDPSGEIYSGVGLRVKEIDKTRQGPCLFV